MKFLSEHFRKMISKFGSCGGGKKVSSHRNYESIQIYNLGESGVGYDFTVLFAYRYLWNCMNIDKWVIFARENCMSNPPGLQCVSIKNIYIGSLDCWRHLVLEAD